MSDSPREIPHRHDRLLSRRQYARDRARHPPVFRELPFQVGQPLRRSAVAGGVDAMLPVVLHVAIAPPPMFGRRVAHKGPQIPDQQGTRTARAMLARLLAPPASEAPEWNH